jgi:hypothetical protein
LFNHESPRDFITWSAAELGITLRVEGQRTAFLKAHGHDVATAREVG